MGPLGLATAIVPSLLFALSAVVLMHRLLRKEYDERVALFGAAFFGLLPSVVWSAISGLEVPLFLALETGALILIDDPRRNRRIGAMVLLALATQVRPEGAILLAIGAIFYYTRLNRERSRSPVDILAPIAATALIAAPYVLFCLETVGRPFPTTLYAKTTGLVSSLPAWGYLGFVYGLLAQENWVGAGLAAIGVVQVIRTLISRRARAVEVIALAWLIALPLAYAMMGRTMLFAGGAGNFGRYLYILFPAGIVLAATGAGVLVSILPAARVTTAVLSMAAVIAALPALKARSELYALNVQNIEEMQVAAARWLRDHLPPGSTVAVNDLGAISFFSGQRVLDLIGIASPGVLRDRRATDSPRDLLREAAAARTLARERPPFLAVFPDWYPRVLGDLESRGALRPLHRIRLAQNRTSGSDLLMIFAVDWNRADEPRPRPN
jgi:hypothetical protein